MDTNYHAIYQNTISTAPQPVHSGELLVEWRRKLECEKIINNEEPPKFNKAEHKKAKLHENDIQNVIFNGPATVVIWRDGTKTVVKCGDMDVYDPEKGLAMAICKYVFGNDGKFKRVFKEWLPKEDDDPYETPIGAAIKTMISKIFSPEKKDEDTTD